MMKDSNDNSQGKLIGKTEKTINVEHPECKRTAQSKKILPSKKTGKTYKVTITYIQITNEEAEIKRAIIASILKKGHLKPPSETF